MSWPTTTFRDVTLRTRTWNPDKEVRDSVKYVDVSAVSRDELQIVSPAHLTRDIPSRARKIVECGDTIFATVRPTLRRVSMVPAELDGEIASTAFCVLRPNRAEIDPDFLFFAAISDPVLNEVGGLQSGASYPAIRDTDVLDCTISLPPMGEQKAIAAALTICRKAIVDQHKALRFLDELKCAAMRELFTRGLRGEAQKDSEIGPVPESWDVARLGEIATLERGRFLHRPRNEPRFYGGNTPFVQTGDVVRSNGRISAFSQSLNDDGVEISRVFATGTILITIAANIGYTGILQMDCACPDSLVGITPSAAITNVYLEQFLRSQQSEMDRQAPVGTQKNINIEFLRPWPIVVPTLAEQSEITAILDAIDAKIDLHRRKKVVLEDLFRALLHKLMTAEIRVADLDLSALESAQEVAT